MHTIRSNSPACALAALVILAMAGQATAAPPVVHGELGARLDAWMLDMERYGVHGALLVEQDGVVILHKGYGVADRGTDRPITGDTIFDIGSLAKQFTATAVLTLVADGKLDVHDSIAKHLPAVPEDKRAITIHHLLTHTAGLAYQSDGRPVLEQPPAFTPGERWSYSNSGYELLGEIVARCSGQPFADYLEERLFRPAGMTRTCCVGTRPWTLDDAAHAYTDATDQGSIATWTVDPGEAGAGGVATCVGDLYAWEQTLRANTILAEPLTTQLFTEHARSASGFGYGYGWMLFPTIRKTRLVMHPGNFGGFNAAYRRYVDEGLTIIFLSNHYVEGRSMRDAVVNRISLMIHGEDVPRPPRVVGPAPATADRYALASGEWLDAVPIDGGVRLTPTGPEGMSLVFAPPAGEEAAAFSTTCAERTRALLGAILAGDRDAARPLVAPALPFESAWSTMGETVAAIVGPQSAPATIEIVGTALSGDGRTGRCVARIVVDGDASLVQLTWNARGVLHFTRVDAPASRDFLAVAADRFAAFDIFSGRTVTLRVTETGLAVHGDDDALLGVMTAVVNSPRARPRRSSRPGGRSSTVASDPR